MPRVRALTSAASTPSTRQLRAHFVASAVPMVAFGFMDNTVMIYAGNAIDCTLGVTFGLSTLSAAACGQICSDVAGVSAGFIDAAAARLGLPTAGFTELQRASAAAGRAGLSGQLVGVVLGCSLGMLNLLLIDTDRARELKIVGAEGGSAAADFTVALSNAEREGATVVTIEGPDVVGLLAAVTAALAAHDFSILDLHAGKADAATGHVRDTFVVVSSETGDAVDDDGLKALGHSLLEACGDAGGARALAAANERLRKTNDELRQQVATLQLALSTCKLHQRQISTTPRRPLESNGGEATAPSETAVRASSAS